MSTHVPGFQSFFKGVLHDFILSKLAISSTGVKGTLIILPLALGNPKPVQTLAKMSKILSKY